MGLFLCEVCNRSLSLDHSCNPTDIKSNIERLRDRAWTAECYASQVENRIKLLIQNLPTMDGDCVIVKAELIRNLWNAAVRKDHHAENADNYLSRWIAMHRILSRAFSLFRERTSGGKNMIQRLAALRDSCDHARLVFGYTDSVFDLEPTDVASRIEAEDA